MSVNFKPALRIALVSAFMAPMIADSGMETNTAPNVPPPTINAAVG